MAFRKIHKPVTKKIWSWFRFLPSFLRKRIVRSYFEISYDLSTDYVFKLAESEEEVEAALRIVYDSYTHLGYIDQRPERVHFNAYLCLPITSILIIKYKDEVVGTMSLVPDSPLGLPSEVTWDLSAVKKETLRIAEVSALTIKRSHKTSKGHLLLTLCKLLYEYGTKTLQLDGVVFSATLEVEPFYTDLLLFSKVTPTTGQEHRLVKGNRSTCCFLDFNKVRARYVSEYDRLPKNRNLFHFFTGFESPNIRLPDEKLSLHGLLQKKNVSMIRVLTRFPHLNSTLTPTDKIRLSNLDPSFALDQAIAFDSASSTRVHPRISMRSANAYVYHVGTDRMFKAALIDVSSRGFGLRSLELSSVGRLTDECIVIFKTDTMTVTARARLQWSEALNFGFEVADDSRAEWLDFAIGIFTEIDLPVDHKRNASHRKNAS